MLTTSQKPCFHTNISCLIIPFSYLTQPSDGLFVMVVPLLVRIAVAKREILIRFELRMDEVTSNNNNTLTAANQSIICQLERSRREFHKIFVGLLRGNFSYHSYGHQSVEFMLFECCFPISHRCWYHWHFAEQQFSF